MMGRMLGLGLVALLGWPLPAEVLSQSQRELGVVVPRELLVTDGKVLLRVDSGGCTDKASIRAGVRKEQGSEATKPHYVLTFERVRVDDCKALLLEGVLLEYDLAKDLGITGSYTLAVTNKVREGIPAEGDALKGELRAATLKALAMELQAGGERLKAAQGGLGPAGNVEKFKQQLQSLEAQRREFEKLDPRDYPLPQTPGTLDPFRSGPLTPPILKLVRATLREPCKEGTLLEVEGITKSGPFYHLAGIVGGDYGRLEPGRTYDLKLYLVYQRDYVGFIPNHYVYVADVK